MSKSSIVKTLQTWDTTYSADSVEWCPIETFLNVFVCGTYQLTQDSTDTNPDRVGRIYLFSFDFDISSLNLLQTLETYGVLDQKWCNSPINGKPHLGVVTAKGVLQIYELIKDNNLKLNMVAEIRLNESLSVIATSLDWSNNKESACIENPSIVVTDTSGSIHIFKYMIETQNLENVTSWKAHDYECWIAAFDSWKTSIVYTGGDDCKLQMYDMRCGFKSQHTITRDVGVTSLHFNNDQENIFASGSYDEIICLWDVRKLKASISELKIGGGVWRLKWEPKKFKMLLAACMYSGFAIVNCEDLTKPMIISTYNDHESIAYGADWCQDLRTTDSINVYNTCNLIATCSFYDHKLNIANINF